MILQILIGLVGLGLVVFVHEAGHLIVAKLVGIEVEAFSIGWGKKLVGYTFRGTEYRISLIPLGGYCRMKGEHALQKAFEDQSDTIPKEKGAFYTARPWQRILVLLAGPAMNLLFAVVVLSIVWYAGFTIQTYGNRIVLESDYPSPAAASGPYPATQAGLKTGDRIVSISGQKIADFRDIEQAVTPSPDTTLKFTVEHPNGTREELSVTPALNKSTGAGRIGVYPWVDPVIGSVQGAAQEAGLEPGDRVLSLNGTRIDQSVQFQSVAQGLAGKSVKLTYERAGRTGTTMISIPSAAQGKAVSAGTDAGIRFKGLSVRTPHYNPVQAIAKGAAETYRTLTLTISGIGLLFRGVDLSSAVAGPIRITYLVGEVATQGFATSARAGFISFFNFLSLLSVVLFFMNLLPIPVLDGGQIVLSGIEGVSRRPLRPRYVHRYQMVGVAIVFLLIFFAFFSDIMYFVRQ